MKSKPFDIFRFYFVNVAFIFITQNNLFDVCIQDLSGKTVFIKTNCQEDTQIDTSVFKSGIYIIELKTKTEIIRKKIAIKSI